MHLLHHNIHQLTRNGDDLDDLLAVGELLDAFIVERDLFQGGLVEVLVDVHLGAEFAVHLEHDFDGAFDGLGFVALGPCDVREAFVVAHEAPHFFGDVRGERVEEFREKFARRVSRDCLQAQDILFQCLRVILDANHVYYFPCRARLFIAKFQHLLQLSSQVCPISFFSAGSDTFVLRKMTVRNSSETS